MQRNQKEWEQKCKILLSEIQQGKSISEWTVTQTDFEERIKDYEKRKSKFPYPNDFIENEIHSVIDNRERLDYDDKTRLYNQRGYELFVQGRDCSIKEWANSLPEIPANSKVPEMQYLFALSKGYVNAKYFYYLLHLSGAQEQKQQQPEPEPYSNSNKTTQKAQIVILNEMGLFENDKFANATLEKQGQFLAALLNMNFDNAKDYLGNRRNKKGGANKSPYNKQSIKSAKEILSLIDIDLNL